MARLSERYGCTFTFLESIYLVERILELDIFFLFIFPNKFAFLLYCEIDFCLQNMFMGMRAF